MATKVPGFADFSDYEPIVYLKPDVIISKAQMNYLIDDIIKT